MCGCKCPLNFGKLILLSTAFLLLFTAYLTAQNLATKILNDNNFGKLGFYSLGVIYVAFAAFSFISPAIVKKLGDKCSFVTGALCYSGYTASFILPLKRSEFPEDKVL